MEKRLFAAIDVGTTTVAVSIINEDNIVIAKDGFLNPEKIFGSDVISRITNSKKADNLIRMKKMMEEAILDSYNKMLFNIAKNKDPDIKPVIKRAVISANTTMASIILGKNIESLGVSPFKMPFTSDEEITFAGVKTRVIAGASAFIGGDILSGLIYLSLKENDILMDLGTNGEIVVRKNNKYYATSAACGPAFENCTRAKGIYGSTTLSAITVLLKKKIISPDIILNENMVKNGIDLISNGSKINISAEILRDVQLAVSAIYSSLYLLIKKAGLNINDINNLYISGGFGFNMSLSDSAFLGIIPEALVSKAKIAGNTSLLGAEILVFDPDKISLLKDMRENFSIINFGGNSQYQSIFEQNLILKRR